MKKNLILLFLFIISNVNAQHRTQVFLSPFGNDNLLKQIENSASYILTEFNKACYEHRQLSMDNNYLTESGIKTISSIWQTKQFYCDNAEIISHAVKRADGDYELREIPVSIKISDDSLQHIDAVLIFTTTGVVNNFYFGLESRRYRDLLQQSKTVREFRRRQIILDFVENYRTAYNRKDLKFIKNVFSDNALIIVGTVIEVQDDNNDFLEKNLGVQKVKYVKHSKISYLKSLDRIFKKNDFINIGFDEIEIFQHPVHNRIYGVTLLQKWTSTTYSDVGYLFLMVDFVNENNPLIHVRTWQPEQFTSDEEIIGLGDFEIIQ